MQNLFDNIKIFLDLILSKLINNKSTKNNMNSSFHYSINNYINFS